MTTKSLGEILKGARENKNLNLTQLAQLTHVPEKILASIEKNDFSVLPPAVFVQGYITACARVLGINPQPVLALLRRDYKTDESGSLLPINLTRPLYRKKLQLGPRFWLGVIMVLLATVVAGYIGFQYWRLLSPPAIIITEPAQNAAVAGTVLVKGQTHPEAVVSVNAQSVMVAPDGSFEIELTFPTQGVGFIEAQATNRRGKSSSVLRSVSVAF